MATGNGALRTLLTLPGEIRNAIYEHALVSPSRRLRLERIEQDDPPHFRFREEHATSTYSLALLQVCKRLRRECAGLFWEKNEILVDATFPLVERIEVFRGGSPERPFLFIQRPFQFIQHLEVQSSLTIGLEETLKFFVDINRLARNGSLKSLTIKGCFPDRSYRYSRPRLSLQNSKRINSVAIAQLRIVGQHSVQIRNSLVLESSLARFIILSSSTSYELNAVFAEFHWAFGALGELWFQDPVHLDQVLLWKDNKQATRLVRDEAGSGVVRVTGP
jgi:hypothetical protein